MQATEAISRKFSAGLFKTTTSKDRICQQNRDNDDTGAVFVTDMNANTVRSKACATISTPCANVKTFDGWRKDLDECTVQPEAVINR
ncbi:hypothetical protein BaRGS_00000672 [Batillaria attramentaria]|uniref:Uncharacterized protein n=1 Tax=Batillaria attramentaria TaxID=370345 RepID=A0ABD0M9A7_9CAEN